MTMTQPVLQTSMRTATSRKRLAFAALTCGLAFAAFLPVPFAQAQDAPTTPQPAHSTQPLKLTGTWQIDPMHTNINFAVRHSVVNQVRGRFNEFSGTISADAEHINKSSVQFTIQAAGIDTGVSLRDGHLKSAEFFDAATYPQITFQSSRVSKKGSGYVAHGTFTMHGVAKEIDLPFQMYGPVKDSFGTPRLGVQSRLRINRQDYGVKWNQILDNGGLAVSNDVDIEINLEAVPPKPAVPSGAKTAAR